MLNRHAQLKCNTSRSVLMFRLNKIYGNIFNCLVYPNISNSTSYPWYNLGPIFPKFVLKLETAWKLWISVRFFHILKSYILRRHHSHLLWATCGVSEILVGLYQDMSHVDLHRRSVRQVPTFVCFSPKKRLCFCSSRVLFCSSNLRNITMPCKLSKTP